MMTRAAIVIMLFIEILLSIGVYRLDRRLQNVERGTVSVIDTKSVPIPSDGSIEIMVCGPGPNPSVSGCRNLNVRPRDLR